MTGSAGGYCLKCGLLNHLSLSFRVESVDARRGCDSWRYSDVGGVAIDHNNVISTGPSHAAPAAVFLRAR
jgi:hypothetical protein